MKQTVEECLQKMGPPLETSFFPRTNDLQRLMGMSLRVLQTVHSSLRVTFLVVLDFFLKMGLVWPPKPACLASYLLFPCLNRESLPFLYWETLWTVCLRHFLQYVFICLGTWTYQISIRNFAYWIKNELFAGTYHFYIAVLINI